MILYSITQYVYPYWQDLIQYLYEPHREFSKIISGGLSKNIFIIYFIFTLV